MKRAFLKYCSILVLVGDRGQECLERRVVPIGWGAVHGGEKELFQAVLVRDEGYARGLEPVAEHMVAIRMGVHQAGDRVVREFPDCREHLRD